MRTSENNLSLRRGRKPAVGWPVGGMKLDGALLLGFDDDGLDEVGTEDVGLEELGLDDGVDDVGCPVGGGVAATTGAIVGSPAAKKIIK